ncbi:hypothetical protein [Selenomonas ruminantium]|uniref:Uncharacterized protein n=1 Tax=Selenomonas ruminantium TaxID=971 RepID=A0A1I0X633_SELRU|nr:hypothetical protein SAMN05216587_104223 [Selenomonas ruminantium]
MELNYNISGEDRKRLVKVVGEVSGIKPKYLGTPSFAFQIGSYEVSKHGVLTFEEDEQAATVLEAIELAGFTAGQSVGEIPESTELQAEKTIEDVLHRAETEEYEPQATADDVMEPIADDKPMVEGVAPSENITSLSISMPRETFTDAALANLDALLDSKGKLIKEAFGIESIEYTLTEGRITLA